MKNRYRFALNLAWACGLLVVPANAVNLFNLTINYTGDSGYQSYFTEAEAIWERIIPSYINGNKTGFLPFSGITINASVVAIDGAGGVLGSAGPDFYGIDNSGYAMATTGTMEFDSADMAGLGANLQTVILHEMAHVIGIGTLWTLNNGLYPNGVYTSPTGQYKGPAGLAAYKTEFGQPSATFVPVELGGGAGTANGHWNESDGGGVNTGIVSNFNRDMRYELMTGWLDTNKPSFISSLTRGSLQDIGYNTQTASATWTSTDNSGTASWGNVANWSGFVPTAYDVATFASSAVERTVTLSSGTYAVDSLQLSHGNSVVIKDGTLNAWAINSTGTSTTTAFKGVTVTGNPNLSLSDTSNLKFLNLAGTAPAAVTVTNVTGGGTIEGDLTINGTHTPGGANTVGTQTFTNNLTYGSGSIFEWDIVTASNTSDSVVIGDTGSLTVTAGAIFKIFSSTAFTDAFWNSSRSWSVMDGFNMLNFTLNYVANGTPQVALDFADQGSFSFTTINGDSLVWAPVPEPTSALAGLLILGGLLRRRREARPGTR